ncbi:Hypothetical protein PHPALM_13552 [Phytophthora palmivora]|uniref:Uncharacterized protein n=1 Tax=Phytophthora palmivora TaxID=4796 RepID=A0A2P4XWZ6_9STRA|nr:Hypothetical protein PHPALM_13552 [Phytophthora palmivora]
MSEEEGVDPLVEWFIRLNGETALFEVMSEVVLTSRLTEEDFHGFVSSITSKEVKLVLVCGTHVRVTIPRLRNRQCTLQKQRPIVITEKQENGEEHHAQILPSGVATSLEELLRDPPDVQRRAAAVLNRLKRKTTIDIRRGF